MADGGRVASFRLGVRRRLKSLPDRCPAWGNSARVVTSELLPDTWWDGNFGTAM